MSREIVASLILRLKDQLSRDLPKTSAALRKHMAEMKKLDQAAKAMAGYDKARANLQKMRGELDKTRENIRRIRTAMQTADGATLAKLRGELGQAQAKSNKTANAMVADMKRVKSAIQQLNAQGIKAKDIPRVRERIDQDRMAAQERFDGDRRRENTGRILRSGGADLRGRGAAATGYSMVGGYAAGRAIGSEYDFQYEANETRAKLYGAEDPESSKAKFQSLVDLAIKTAETRPWTSAEVMAGARYLAGTGLNQGQVEGAIAPTVDLATAGGRELGIDKAADISTNILMAMKMPMQTTEEVLSSLGRINDVLAYTAAKSNTSVIQLGEAFKYAAPLAGQMGMNIEELSSYFAVMSNNGIKASEAGVALRSALVRMIKPVKPMMAELGRLGIELDDYVTRSDALSGKGIVASLEGSGIRARGLEGQLQRLVDDGSLGGDELMNAIADVIQEKLGDDSLVDREVLTNAIVDALSAGITDLDLMGFLEAIYKKSGGNPGGSAPYVFDARQGARLTTMISGPDDPMGPRGYLSRIGGESEGTAAGMSQIMMDGMVGDLKRLQSALDSFMRTFFESGAADIVSDLAKAATDFLVALKEIDPRLLELGAKFFTLSLLIGPLIYAMGGVLSIAGSLMLLKGLAGRGGIGAALGGGAGAAAGGTSSAKGGGKGEKGGIGAGRSVAGAFTLWGIFDGFVDFENRKQAYEEQGLSKSEALTRAMQDNQAATDSLSGWLAQTIGTPRSWLGLNDETQPSSSTQPTFGPSFRAAETRSMNDLRRDPNGVQDALDDAASDRQARSARTEAQVQEILARSLAGAVANVERAGKSGRLGSTPVPSPSPQSDVANSRISGAFQVAAEPVPNGFSSAIDGMIAAIERQSGTLQPVKVETPVTTVPSGVQSVNVTNPPPPVLAPVNVTVHVTQTNASPAAIGSATGNAVAGAVKGAQTNSYSDD